MVQNFKDPALSLLQLGLLAVAWVQSLAGELPYVSGVALKQKKGKQQQQKSYSIIFNSHDSREGVVHCPVFR